MADPQVLEFDDLQGNILAGFNKDPQTFLLVRLPDTQTDTQAWLGDVVEQVASHTEVAAFNELYKQLKARRQQRSDGVLSVIWMNLAFTPSGLAKLGHTEPLGEKPEAFAQGLAARGPGLGHVGSSAPETWLPCFRQAGVIDAVLVIAGDDPDDLCEAVLEYVDGVGTHGGSIVQRLEGNARVDDWPRTLRFQRRRVAAWRSRRDITESERPEPGRSRPRSALARRIRDRLSPAAETGATPGGGYAPQPQPTIDINSPGDTTPATPDWTKNGSFLVFQRLQQAVAEFRAFVTQNAPTVLASIHR